MNRKLPNVVNNELEDVSEEDDKPSIESIQITQREKAETNPF